MGKKVTTAALAGFLMFGIAVTGCAGPAAMSASDKKALDDPLLSAELTAGGICSTAVVQSDADANRCAGMLTLTTLRIAEVQALAKQHGVRDSQLDSSADQVDQFTRVCDPKSSGASISHCLSAAGTIKTNATTYVQALRTKLDAAK